MADPKPNYDESVQFSKDFFGERPRHIASIAKGGGLTARAFQPDEDNEMRDFIEEQNSSGGNIYFAVNEIAETAWNKKAQKADVTRVTALHCDLDVLSDEALQRLVQFTPKPSIILCSGGGYQAFWLLEDAEEAVEGGDCEQLNKAIADKVGGDACHNLDRMMRVPGTINHPNAKKQKAGRTLVVAYLLHEHTDYTCRYVLSDFDNLKTEETRASLVFQRKGGKEIAIRNPVNMGISKDSQLYKMLLLGDDSKNPIGTENGKKTRSEFRFSLIFELANRGLEYDEIAGIMLNPELGISESYLDRKGGNPQKLAVYEAQKAILKIAENWPELTRDGKPKMGFMNAMFGVSRMGLTFSNNIFQNRKQAGGHPLQEFQGDLSDDGMAMLRSLFVEMFGFDVGKGHIFDAVQVHCVENSYHPVRDYLNGLEHDGVPRIEAFFVDYMEAEDTPLNRAIAKLMFVAAVRRIRQPGCKFDEMVVIEGLQGTGKSTAFKTLAGDENFTDQNIFAMDPKAQAEIIEGNWIVEVPELSGMRHADINSVKATLSRSEDQIRPAYARFKERWPRQCIFVGTTNEDTYLKDETGNRRFLPVKTGQIDLEGIKLDRDQLWAEAAELEADGFSIQLPPDLWADAKEAQDTRMPPDPWEDKLSELTGISIENGFERISSVDIFNTDNLNISGGNQKDYHAKHAAKVMRKLEWDGPKAIRIKGKTKRGYERPVSLSDGGSDDVPY